MNIVIMDKFKNKVNKREIFRSIAPSPFASLVMEKVNIVVADKEVVDFISPPEMRRFLDPECVSGLKERILERLKRGLPRERPRESLEKFSEKIWRDLKDCEREIWTIFTARGYYKRISSNDQYELREEFGIDIPEGPSIFVAFDRVEESADYVAEQLGITLYRALESILTITFVHETFHAFTDLNGRRYIGEIWFRMMEESLANYTAYLAIRDSNELIFLFDAQKQPFEYRCWVVWRNIVPPPAFLSISTSWARNAPEYLLILPFYWLSLVNPHFILLYQALRPTSMRLFEVLQVLYSIYRWDPVMHEFFHYVIEPLLYGGTSLDTYWKFLALGVLSLALHFI